MKVTRISAGVYRFTENGISGDITKWDNGENVWYAKLDGMNAEDVQNSKKEAVECAKDLVQMRLKGQI
jgi:hypothetical protein